VAKAAKLDPAHGIVFKDQALVVRRRNQSVEWGGHFDPSISGIWFS
jgi:hypothetical protein